MQGQPNDQTRDLMQYNRVIVIYVVVLYWDLSYLQGKLQGKWETDCKSDLRRVAIYIYIYNKVNTYGLPFCVKYSKASYTYMIYKNL